MAEKKYIELQKALSVCKMHYEHCLEMQDWSGDSTADNIRRDIETLPTADVVEVKHGEWILRRESNGVRTHQCSVCGRPIYTIDEDLKDYAPYCHCGAKMDGRSDKQ